ncbi:hypothetical protein [Rhodococcus sp. PvP104]|uniref:hypothetical protein n=1 Tax=Rhodococcus sp. PvP104 TaxID=2817911 RepID=UPI001AE1D674|nr:hypothetical protein [Rhodococcus sp. PvP104]MBP2522251.1 hypothetical protein [Rhodococcus sp. PvP104]
MSSYGEDIIRETFEKFGDAIGVQMQIPDAMIANLGAVLQAQIDLLAELQSTGRLIPAGGMALTAEQVEDVRTAREALRGYRNFTGYGRSHVNRLIAAVDALFPATEPAEVISRYQTMQRGFAAKHFGFPANPVFEDRYTAPDGGKWQWTDELQWELRCYPPAPAEPAEEETKAERDSEGIIRINGGRIVALSRDPRELVQQWFDLAEPGSKWQRDYAAALDLFDREAASSPVVPSPTETGPWQTVDAIQVGVPFEDKEGSQLVKLADGKFGYLSYPRETPETLAKSAPFVAAAEEG